MQTWFIRPSLTNSGDLRLTLCSSRGHEIHPERLHQFLCLVNPTALGTALCGRTGWNSACSAVQRSSQRTQKESRPAQRGVKRGWAATARGHNTPDKRTGATSFPHWSGGAGVLLRRGNWAEFLRVECDYFRGFLAELADDADGEALAVGDFGDGVAAVAVEAGEGVFVEFHAQGALGFGAGALLGEFGESFAPVFKFVFVAAAEEDLARDEVAAVVVGVEHPVGDVLHVAAFHEVFDGVVNVETGDFHDDAKAGALDADVGLAARR